MASEEKKQKLEENTTACMEEPLEAMFTGVDEPVTGALDEQNGKQDTQSSVFQEQHGGHSDRSENVTVDTDVKEGTDTVDTDVKEGTDIVDTVAKEGTATVDTVVKEGTSTVDTYVKEGTSTVDTDVKEGTDKVDTVAKEGTDTVVKEGTSTVDTYVKEGTSTVDTDVKEGTDIVDTVAKEGTATVDTVVKEGTSTVDPDVKECTSTVDTDVKEGTATVDTDVNEGASTEDTNVNEGTATADTDIKAGTTTLDTNVKTDSTTVDTSVKAEKTTVDIDVKVGTTSDSSEEACQKSETFDDNQTVSQVEKVGRNVDVAHGNIEMEELVESSEELRANVANKNDSECPAKIAKSETTEIEHHKELSVESDPICESENCREITSDLDSRDNSASSDHEKGKSPVESISKEQENKALVNDSTINVIKTTEAAIIIEDLPKQEESAETCKAVTEPSKSKDCTCISEIDESAHSLVGSAKDIPSVSASVNDKKGVTGTTESVNTELDTLNVSSRATFGDSSCDNMSLSGVSETKSGGFERRFSVERIETDDADMNLMKEERLEKYLESMRSVTQTHNTTEAEDGDEENIDPKDACKLQIKTDKLDNEIKIHKISKSESGSHIAENISSETKYEDNVKCIPETSQSSSEKLLPKSELSKSIEHEIQEAPFNKAHVDIARSTESSNGEKSQTDMEVALIMQKGLKEEDRADIKIQKTVLQEESHMSQQNEDTAIPDVEVDPRNDKDLWSSEDKTELKTGDGFESQSHEKKKDKLLKNGSDSSSYLIKEENTSLEIASEFKAENETEKDTVVYPEKEVESAFLKLPVSNKGRKDTEQPREILKRKMFDEFTEDSSNSSWYIIKDKPPEEPMDTDDKNRRLLVTDEGSNLSIPDDSSLASASAMEDSRLSFTDQVSNIDETSNLSAGDSCSVKAFGHEIVLDESANLNPPDKDLFVQPSTPSSVITDATSEATPVKRYRRGTLAMAVEEASSHGHNIRAKDLFEYQWPQESGADWFMLQEQISTYLEVKSFKRKYPDLFRRVCDKLEKDFLREKGVVSETQSDLGLTALKSEEVHELISKDYPSKYREYCTVLHEKEKEIIVSKQKDYVLPKLEKSKMKEYTLKAMKSTAEWNRHFLKERNEERRAYFDMQTFAVQYPKTKFRKLENIKTSPTAYPVPLIPGQFQEYCRKYSAEELKYFPLNTALFDPPKKMKPGEIEEVPVVQVAENQPKEPKEVPKAPSVSGSESSSSESGESDVEEKEDNEKDKSSSRETSAEKLAEQVPIKIEAPAECWVCIEEEKQGKSKNKKKTIRPDEELVGCSECKKIGHASCLDLTDSMLKVIKTYPWQCMECKTCVECMDPTDEDKMLFCDRCDRGYHTFCVGLRSLPTGKWECVSCRGDTTPVKPGPKPQAKSVTKGKRGRKPKNLDAR